MRPSLVVLILLIFLAAVTARAHAETMPPLTEPGAEAPQLVMPAKLDTEYKAWARGWQRLDLRMRRQLVRHTDALGLPRPRAVPKASDYGSWWEYGVACRRQARYWRDSRIPYLHRLIVRPGGHGARRWLPLCWYVGWPRSQAAHIVYCITHESGGRPGARNQYSTARGLWQILGGSLNPETSTRQALGMWRERGWQPWVVMWW